MSDANAAYAGGERALPIAVMKRRHDLVKLLLDFKADPNAKDKDGFTDLMLACKEKKEEAADLLTDATKNAAALDVQDTKYKRSEHNARCIMQAAAGWRASWRSCWEARAERGFLSLFSLKRASFLFFRRKEAQ